ncbi:hypothetical protein D3C86_2103420 [compost metagenome]
MFRATNGVRIVTDLEGSIKAIVGIIPETVAVQLTIVDKSYEFIVNPNEVYGIEKDRAVRLTQVAFDY